MRKQILIAFLCGLVLPLAMMSMRPNGSGKTVPEDVESEALSETQDVPVWDAQQRVTVLSESGNLRQMRLDEYLVGVVLAEMPVNFEKDALMAQAVVARTYTCKRMENSKHEAAAVCTDSGCCQGFRDAEDYVNSGGGQDAVEVIRSAVFSTDGQVLVYGGELIDATYFSCSGGMTEDAVAVWGRDVPYLQSVKSPGEEAAPRYSDRISYSPENFRKLTGCDGSGNPAGWFGGIRRTDGGGVDTIEICGKTYSGTELRGMLGLRSTMFSVSVEDGMIVITTKGFGHRVGMSQYGAQAMALEGNSYREILEHYYSGALLKKWDTEKTENSNSSGT